MEAISFRAVVDGEQVIRPPAGLVLPEGTLDVTVKPVTPKSPPEKPLPDRDAANLRLRQQRVSLGHPTGTDNESIDAELARVYDNRSETR